MTNNSLLGAASEFAFMARALEHGLRLFRPVAPIARYDVIVEGEASFNTVQVKSVTTRNNRAYKINTATGNRRRKPYTREQVDFIAACIVPCDAWYIIPVAACEPKTTIWLYPHVANSRGRFERYREAWHLLDRLPWVRMIAEDQ